MGHSGDLDAIERQLVEELAAVRKARELLGRYASQQEPGLLPTSLQDRSGAATVDRARKATRRRKASPAEICRELLTSEWQPVDFFWEKVKEQNPKTDRQVVATALRREVASGHAEKQGDRADGVRFRRKEA